MQRKRADHVVWQLPLRRLNLSAVTRDHDLWGAVPDTSNVSKAIPERIHPTF